MEKVFYSIRTGKNKNTNGFQLKEILVLFERLYAELISDGYFSENFGFHCVDQGFIAGNIKDVSFDIFVKLRKDGLWPIHNKCQFYVEDDLFDMIEYLFTTVSKPIHGYMHSWDDCGMHWETFNKSDGESYFRTRINALLNLYVNKFELSQDGEVLSKPDEGFETIFQADIPTLDKRVNKLISAAISKFRRHGASLDDRRHAVTDLAGVLENLRPKMKATLTKADERDLFDIANNFGIRHHNDKQKTGYDQALWLSWMFYFYLSTIHVVLRKLEKI